MTLGVGDLGGTSFRNKMIPPREVTEVAEVSGWLMRRALSLASVQIFGNGFGHDVAEGTLFSRSQGNKPSIQIF
jgi:hypothetical protein